MSRGRRFEIKIPFTASRKHQHMSWVIPCFDLVVEGFNPSDYYLAFDARTRTLILTERDDAEPSQVEPLAVLEAPGEG